jgi:integrase
MLLEKVGGNGYHMISDTIRDFGRSPPMSENRIEKHTTEVIMRISDLPHVAAHDDDGTARVAKKTQQLYETSCVKLAKFLGDDREVAGLSGNDLLAFHNWLHAVERAHIRTATANSYRRTLRAIFNRIGRPELGKPLRQLREPPSRDKAMEEADLRLILTYAGLRDAALIAFLSASGARRATVCNMLKSDLNIGQGKDGRYEMWAVLPTKDQSSAMCFFTHEAALLTLGWLSIQPNAERTPYVFTTPEGNALAPGTINSIFRDLKQRAKLPKETNINPHALRHKFTKDRLNAGQDIALVSGLLNHSSVLTTMAVYAPRSEKELMNAFFRK